MEDTIKKRIRFINSEYETLFFVDDGGEIEIRIDGIRERAKCRYIDEHHAEIGRIVYHICEFAEKRERFGQPCRPVSKRAGFPVMVLEVINAFADLPRIRETRKKWRTNTARRQIVCAESSREMKAGLKQVP
jgi:hypothetical protein